MTTEENKSYKSYDCNHRLGVVRSNQFVATCCCSVLEISRIQGHLRIERVKKIDVEDCKSTKTFLLLSVS